MGYLDHECARQRASWYSGPVGRPEGLERVNEGRESEVRSER